MTADMTVFMSSSQKKVRASHLLFDNEKKRREIKDSVAGSLV